jgi:hypothetical protein
LTIVRFLCCSIAVAQAADSPAVLTPGPSIEIGKASVRGLRELDRIQASEGDRCPMTFRIRE